MKRTKSAAVLTEEEIDEQVVAQSTDEGGWDAPVHVEPLLREVALRLPVQTARRAQLLARREGYSHLDEWLLHLISKTVERSIQCDFPGGGDIPESSDLLKKPQRTSSRSSTITAEARSEMSEAQRRHKEKVRK